MALSAANCGACRRADGVEVEFGPARIDGGRAKGELAGFELASQWAADDGGKAAAPGAEIVAEPLGLNEAQFGEMVVVVTRAGLAVAQQE